MASFTNNTTSTRSAAHEITVKSHADTAASVTASKSNAVTNDTSPATAASAKGASSENTASTNRKSKTKHKGWKDILADLQEKRSKKRAEEGTLVVDEPHTWINSDTLAPESVSLHRKHCPKFYSGVKGGYAGPADVGANGNRED